MEVIYDNTHCFNNRVHFVDVLMTSKYMCFNCRLDIYQPNEILEFLVKNMTNEIGEWLDYKYPLLDMDEYGGGYQQWFRVNSGPMNDLGLTLQFTYSGNQVRVTVE